MFTGRALIPIVSYKDNNRKYHECECDIALEDFEVTVESEYRASELKF